MRAQSINTLPTMRASEQRDFVIKPSLHATQSQFVFHGTSKVRPAVLITLGVEIEASKSLTTHIFS
jgi:hypothetical protein